METYMVNGKVQLSYKGYEKLAKDNGFEILEDKILDNINKTTVKINLHEALGSLTKTSRFKKYNSSIKSQMVRNRAIIIALNRLERFYYIRTAVLKDFLNNKE